MFTSVIPPQIHTLKPDFPVFLGSIFAKVSETQTPRKNFIYIVYNRFTP